METTFLQNCKDVMQLNWNETEWFFQILHEPSCLILRVDADHFLIICAQSGLCQTPVK